MANSWMLWLYTFWAFVAELAAKSLMHYSVSIIQICKFSDGMLNNAGSCLWVAALREVSILEFNQHVQVLIIEWQAGKQITRRKWLCCLGSVCCKEISALCCLLKLSINCCTWSRDHCKFTHWCLMIQDWKPTFIGMQERHENVDIMKVISENNLEDDKAYAVVNGQ